MQTRSRLLGRVRFPASPRVLYDKNPLVEVICQVRFQRLLRLDAEVPVGFQEAIRSTYPVLREKYAARIPDDVARLIGVDLGNVSTRSYDFFDSNETWKISLTGHFMAVSTRAYRNWEEFKARLHVALDLLEKLYGVTQYTRVGLRYRDLIRRSRLGLERTSWSKLLRPELLGELREPMFEDAVQVAGRQLQLALDASESAVRISHGLAFEDDPEPCYIIDADFYRDVETERTHAQELLDIFREESGNLFRWCITKALHDAMEPRSP